MKAVTWINNLKKLTSISAVEFSDFEKLTEEELYIIGLIKADIDNNISDLEHLKKGDDK